MRHYSYTEVTVKTLSCQRGGESVAIIAISKDAIFSVDSAGVVKSWNMAAESLFGIPSQLILNHHYSSFEQLSLLGLESVLTKGGKQSTFTTPYTDDEKEEHTLTYNRIYHLG